LCANVDDDLLDRSSLVLSEVVTNSVKHARLGPSQLIDVEVALLTSLLRIEVIDDGVGLWLVDQLADRWGVDCSHSTRVWLEFDRDPS
jgi:anti-sigma regulatory factor (Ser/Thr protein kinase)